MGAGEMIALSVTILAALPHVCTHEHATLVGGFHNPAALGYAPIPLNLSYSSVPLPVHGSVPGFLNGTLYRDAPGAWPDGWWLDGLITLNAFKFEGGKVYYSMKWNKVHACV